MATTNRQFRLAYRPIGLPKASDWTVVDAPVGEPGPGQALVKVLYLSVDPAMRGWMNEGRSYVAPVAIGDVMRAGGVGRVIASGSADLAVGDCVSGWLGVQEYAVADGKALYRVDPRVAPLA